MLKEGNISNLALPQGFLEILMHLFPKGAGDKAVSETQNFDERPTREFLRILRAFFLWEFFHQKSPFQSNICMRFNQINVTD